MAIQPEHYIIKDLARQIIEQIDQLKHKDKTHIDILKLSTRAKRCLDRRSIEYVEDLISLSKKDVMRIRYMGQHTFDEINAKVKSLGLRGWE